jgi:hypothetical protein
MLEHAHAEKLKALPEWQALEEHITDCITALDNCSSIPDSDDHDKAARGRKEAVRVLLAILEPFHYSPKPMQDKRTESLRKLGLDV